MTLEIKRGDTLPPLTITLTDDGAVDLTAAQSIRVIGTRAGVEVFDRTATGDAAGVVVMDFQTGDTDTVGRILVEVEVTWDDGVQTFPPDTYLAVDVTPDLG